MVTLIHADPRLAVATMDEINEQKHGAYELGKTKKNTTRWKSNIIDTQLTLRTNASESREGAFRSSKWEKEGMRTISM